MLCVCTWVCLFACLASTRDPTLVSTCVLPLTYSLLFFVLRQFYRTVLAGLELIVKASFELRDLPLSVSLVQWLKVCTTPPGLSLLFFKYWKFKTFSRHIFFLFYQISQICLQYACYILSGLYVKFVWKHPFFPFYCLILYITFKSTFPISNYRYSFVLDVVTLVVLTAWYTEVRGWFVFQSWRPTWTI